jgi:hypothetical protein
MFNRTRSTSSRRFAAITTAAALPLITACGGGGGADEAEMPPAFVCEVPMDTIIGYSLERFIGTRTPVPYLFMLPLGTDSMVPDGAQFPLNSRNRGAYPWPQDAAMQKEAIAGLRKISSLPTVALFYHGTKEVSEGKYMTEFSGTYHDVKLSGINLMRTEVYFDCKAPAGQRVRTGDEPPPVDTATPAAGGAAAAGSGGGL